MMRKKRGYWWDRGGVPDPEIERLERLFEGFRSSSVEESSRVRARDRIRQQRDRSIFEILSDQLQRAAASRRFTFAWATVATVLLAVLATTFVVRLLTPPQTYVVLSVGWPEGQPSPIGGFEEERRQLPVDIQVIPPAGHSPVRVQAVVDLQSGAGRVALPTSEIGTILAYGADDGVELGGVGRLEPGYNVINLGGPFSRAKSDYDHVAAIYSDPESGQKLVSSLPFDVRRVHLEGESELIRTSLADGVGAVYFDDMAVYDGDKFLWSDDFERYQDGSYPDEPLRSIFPDPETPIESGVLPQGIVSRSPTVDDGAKCFLSVSGPGRARIDGVSLRRDSIVSGLLHYKASVYLNSADGRGALISLKQETGDPGRWYDKAGVLFVHGEIRAWSSNQIIGYYYANQWHDVEVTVRLPDRVMSVSLNGHTIAEAVPTMVGEGMKWEQPSWDEKKIWEDFDYVSFGGVFFAPPEEGRDNPMIIEDQGQGWVTYRLDGARPGWQPTLILLKPGDRLEVEASGEIFNNHPGPSRTDPDGCQLLAPDPCSARGKPDPRSSAPAPAAWAGALVGRIGDGEGFFVGKSGAIPANRPGRLSLAYNDSYYADNRGHFLVRISR